MRESPEKMIPGDSIITLYFLNAVKEFAQPLHQFYTNRGIISGFKDYPARRNRNRLNSCFVGSGNW